MVVPAGEVLGLRARGSPAKLRREVRLRSMGDSLAVARGEAGEAAGVGGGAQKGCRRCRAVPLGEIIRAERCCCECAWRVSGSS